MALTSYKLLENKKQICNFFTLDGVLLGKVTISAKLTKINFERFQDRHLKLKKRKFRYGNHGYMISSTHTHCCLCFTILVIPNPTLSLLLTWMGGGVISVETCTSFVVTKNIKRLCFSHSQVGALHAYQISGVKNLKNVKKVSKLQHLNPQRVCKSWEQEKR